jgi:hypothetical protein
MDKVVWCMEPSPTQTFTSEDPRPTILLAVQRERMNAKIMQSRIYSHERFLAENTVILDGTAHCWSRSVSTTAICFVLYSALQVAILHENRTETSRAVIWSLEGDRLPPFYTHQSCSRGAVARACQADVQPRANKLR